MSSQVRHIKKVPEPQQTRGIILDDERHFWLTMRQAILVQLAALNRKIGKTQRCCESCGKVL